jgi:hypothetical protein
MVLKSEMAGVPRSIIANVADATIPIPFIGTAISNAPEAVNAAKAGIKYVKNVRQASKVTNSLKSMEDPVERAKLYRSQEPEVQNKIKIPK